MFESSSFEQRCTIDDDVHGWSRTINEANRSIHLTGGENCRNERTVKLSRRRKQDEWVIGPLGGIKLRL